MGGIKSQAEEECTAKSVDVYSYGRAVAAISKYDTAVDIKTGIETKINNEYEPEYVYTKTCLAVLGSKSMPGDKYRTGNVQRKSENIIGRPKGYQGNK
jgi:hypothetical protein